MPSERRENRDRRQKPTRPISHYTMVGRRKEARRVEEKDNYYVDRYEGRLLFLVGLILVFCALDTFFSLKIFQYGGQELNVFMLSFMKKSLILSLVVKFSITIFCTVFLLVHKNFRVFRRIKTEAFLYFIFGVYFILILFEIFSYLYLRGLF